MLFNCVQLITLFSNRSFLAGRARYRTKDGGGHFQGRGGGASHSLSRDRGHHGNGRGGGHHYGGGRSISSHPGTNHSSSFLPPTSLLPPRAPLVPSVASPVKPSISSVIARPSWGGASNGFGAPRLPPSGNSYGGGGYASAI